MADRDKGLAERAASLPGDRARTETSGPVLRERAEAALREQAAWSPENLDGLTPEATRQTLHELRVHQIELEMQNEELRRAQHELDLSRSRYFDLYDLAPVGYCSVSETGMILEANLTAIALLGVVRGALATQPFSRFILKEYQNIYYLFRKQLIETGEPQACELQLVKMNGAAFWAHLAATAAQDEHGATVLRIVLSDISERKQLEDQVREMAFNDTLTKLPNRRLLDDRLRQALATGKRSGFFGAVMFLDLDEFKLLNDKHGHAVGDLLLIEAADRLRNCVREVDTVARFGGDEFVVIVSELDSARAESAEQARVIAEKIRSALAKPYVLLFRHEETADATVEHQCSVSIGVALFGKGEASQDDTLKRADTAMYQAKEAGRNLIRFYDLQG